MNADNPNPNEPVDLLVVGGGVNGVGIARDAVGRGLSVLLAEKSDLASATSSASTKLIHGGLRYLEYYEFRLVREALSEREVLLASAPHIIWPLRFVLPHEKSLRPAWMIRIGLFLYDHLGGRRTLPGSHKIDLMKAPYAGALKPGLRTGFEYSDCWVNDARLVALLAMDARERGARVFTHTACVAARREGSTWLAELQDEAGRRMAVRARALINAAGPWTGEFLAKEMGRSGGEHLRLVKGSHIVVNRIYPGEHAFILQNNDRRIVFTIPYEEKFTLIGTTDIPYHDDPGKVHIAADETQYLCDVVNQHFARQITPADVVWSYAGVRPLFDEDGGESASAVSRDYVLDLEHDPGGPPLMNVFGGKITTHRRLSEHALQKLQPYFPAARGDWTAKATLPGGDMPGADFAGFLAEQKRRFAWLPAESVYRFARAYGTRMERMLGESRSLADLGMNFGGDLYEREVEYMIAEEWAVKAQDVLWRRSKLGLHLGAEAEQRLSGWLASRGPATKVGLAAVKP